MDKKPLIGVSILAVVLLVLASVGNVLGYQTIQTSQQNIIKERTNQKELLFQTIVDIANNKNIQRIILKSQISKGQFPISDIPVLTKNQLKMIYFIGLILSKIISKSRMQSMFQQDLLIYPMIQKEISAVIEKDSILDSEISLLKNSDCNCENVDTTPMICIVTYLISTVLLLIAEFFDGIIFLFTGGHVKQFLILGMLWWSMVILGQIFECSWAQSPYL